MSEKARLIDRLFNNPDFKLRNIHISRGDKPCTAEQLCAEINKALDDIASGAAEEVIYID